jgi:FKBP-type peptidyl-prolyl cis-trans isomerase (trigger factor)
MQQEFATKRRVSWEPPPPTVVPCALGEVEVEPPPAPKPSPTTVAERFRAEVRKRVPWRALSPGERVAPGDHVLFDILGIVEGQLIPFSPHANEPMFIRPMPNFPGLCANLVRKPVGERFTVQIRLPKNHPIARLRGKQGEFLARINSARRFEMPEDMDAPFFASIGLDAKAVAALRRTTEEVCRAEAMQEHGTTVLNLILDQAIARSKIEVPASTIESAVVGRWNQSEGRAVRALGLPGEIQEASLRTWMSEPSVLQQAEKDVKTALFLAAVAERDDIDVSGESVKTRLRRAGAPLGDAAKTIFDSFDALDEQTSKAILGVTWYLPVIEHVMKRCIKKRDQKKPERSGAIKKNPPRT